MGPTAAAPYLETLDRERGRLDPRDRLRHRLPEAPADYLDGALDNPETGPEEIEILLRNPRAAASTLERVGRTPSWMRDRGVRRAFVAHRRAPLVLSRAQLPHLFWRDLAGLAADVRLAPALRRDAEKLLRVRLPELTLGEKIAVARRASRGLIAILGEEGDARILRALAGSPRATESDVLKMIARNDAPGEVLGWLVGQSRFRDARAVLLAVVRHRRTPPAAALRAIGSLSAADLDALGRDERAPSLVRVAAERRRGARAADGAAPRPDQG